MEKDTMRGDRLRKLRENLGLSQRDLAEQTGLSQTQIARWENGVNIPSSEALRSMVDYFGVTADYLLGLVDQPQAQISSTDLSAGEQHIVTLIRAGLYDEVMRLMIDYKLGKQGG